MTRTLHEHTEIAPANDATSCPSNRIPWDRYLEKTRMYSDADIDAKMLALYTNAVNNGRDILQNRALITEISNAFVNHIQNHGGTAVGESYAGLKALIDKAQAQLDELVERTREAGEILNG